MSSDRRFEYEKGPRLEEVNSSGESESDDGADGGADERARSVGPIPAVLAGFGAGATAFATVLAVLYQLVASMDAAGYFSSGEAEPGRWVMTRLIGLANHGATLEVGGDPIESGISIRLTSRLVSHVTALIPAAVLLAAGYLLVRHVRLETRREIGLAVGSLVASYVALALVVAGTTEWTPEGDDVETLAVATDVGTAVSITRTALVFVGIGAAIAALPRILEAAPLDLASDAD
ncbi:hypothetical protein [Haloterrigena alkaliphila]|uniref:DUF7978 domain-containing protein n=1 Tax=Haloterrigena alkaliphila TaxID=2816475 RepID=A0A8A2VJM3_9EURY|nr:hypothetical protein [Haloterrigena alkaliphila]QSX00676.1 hypothetical protein J0X25_06880 [Haloterrigena alkaliphila]